jgi:galactokinase/mevalonate kinase-like predicted kinase
MSSRLVQIADSDEDCIGWDQIPSSSLEHEIRCALQYLELDHSDNILLKQQRLIMLIALLVWNHPNMKMEQQLVHDLAHAISNDLDTRQAIVNAITTRQDKYYEFMDVFFKAANLKELKDFEICMERESTRLSKGFNLKWSAKGSVHTESGMRIGISSANASDNWTNSKLRGGRVINLCVNLNGIAPVSSTCSLVDPMFDEKDMQILLILSSKDSLSGSLETSQLMIQEENIHALREFDDPKDTFRMLKYAFFFVGILDLNDTSSSISEQLKTFCRGKTLKLAISNLGPSRSGFASSSAVSANLLKGLYLASGQEHLTNDFNLFGSLVLLFENQLGLKSGRQDIDGLLPNGLKVIRYLPTNDVLVPSLDLDSMNRIEVVGISENLILVDSGIQRPSSLGRTRGLNMRHWSLLTRDSATFPALIESYKVHDKITEALIAKDWKLLGELFLEYMTLRERIDPGATSSIYDADAGRKVLRDLFDPLVSEGLIFGGMFTGAMGGGVAMLVPTEKGKSMSRISQYLTNLKNLVLGSGERPFKRLGIISYSINTSGLRGWIE